MDAKQAQKILLDEQKNLTDLRRQLKEACAPVELDQQAVGRLSRMDALQKQNMELATEQRRQQRLHIIDAALKRIDAGDFGFCVICDEAISPQRLAFDPAVACCVTCRN
jgi:DnaK suppressor protein